MVKIYNLEEQYKDDFEYAVQKRREILNVNEKFYKTMNIIIFIRKIVKHYRYSFTIRLCRTNKNYNNHTIPINN